MSASRFIGIDVGSASVRAGLFTAEGKRLCFATRPIEQFHSQGDWVEQSSAQIWQGVCETVREVLQQSATDPNQVKGMGFDATCSLVAIDHQGQGVTLAENGDAQRNIMMWMDHRAKAETRTINATHHETLNYVGGEMSVEMELPKILWLKNHYPERYQRTWRFFDLADYLVWQATGADVASVCTLTCKWGYLAHEHQFRSDFLQAIGLDDLSQKIPTRVCDLGEAVGTLSEDAARQLGLTTATVVASGIIDAHAGGLALTATTPQGSLAVISGTSNCHMLVNREPLPVQGVWGPYYNAMLPGWWLTEGGQSAAGALVEWSVRQHAYWPELQKKAEAAGQSVWQVLNLWLAELEQQERWPTRHLHMLGDHHGNRSPRANPDARGALLGLTLETGQFGLARLYLASLQAVAYGTRHIIEALQQAGHNVERLVFCGGATKNPVWLREYANITGYDVHRVTEEDAVTLGAALMAAVASGEYADFPAAAAVMVSQGETVSHDPATAAFHQAKYEIYLQMYQEGAEARAKMAAFTD